MSITAGQKVENARRGEDDIRGAKDRFLAMMSHEIRTPLNGLLGIVGLLQDGSLDEEQRHLLEIASRSGQQLNRVVNDILDFARLDAGPAVLERRSYRIRDLIENVASLVRSEATAKGLSVRTSVNDGVPAVLMGDPERIRQVLFNLARNAVKFTESGRVVISAERTVVRQEPALSFRVEDTGIGIPESRQQALFEPFATGDASYTRDVDGTGLGLAIAKALVDAMHGSIAVCSEAGRGAAFRFDLPLEESVAPEFAPESGGQIKSAKLTGLHALLVDDNPISQIDALGCLETLGCRIDVAGSGREALEAAWSRPFDFILMDLAMPHPDGLAVTREIRGGSGHNAGTPIIGLSPYALETDRQLAGAAGMSDLIAKPVSGAALAQTVARHIDVGEVDDRDEIRAAVNLVRHFDGTVLLPAVDGQDADMRRELLAQFGKDVESRTALLVRACRNRDWGAVQTAGCALKSLAGAFGATSLLERATAIISAGRTEDASGLQSEIRALEVLVPQILEVLGAWEQELSQKPT